MLAAESQPVVATIKRERLSSPACGAQAGASPVQRLVRLFYPLFK